MIKKISIYLILIFFSTNVVAQDLIMKCGEYTYKYISDPSGDKVLYKHPKGTKNKYKEWCKKEATKPALSREGWVRIIKDNKAIINQIRELISFFFFRRINIRKANSEESTYSKN